MEPHHRQALEMVEKQSSIAFPTRNPIFHLLRQPSWEKLQLFIQSILLFRTSPSRALVHRKGIAALEFALCAPALALLLTATADLIILLKQEFTLEQVSSQMGEIISQCKAVNSPVDLSRFDAEAQIIAGETSLTAPDGSGNFIVTVIAKNADGRSIAQWQHAGGNQIYGSILCANAMCRPGDIVTLPNGYVIPSGQVLISVEAVSSFSPWIFAADFLPSKPIMPRYYSFFLARSSNPATLTTLGQTQTQGCGS